ncbi:NAD(P)-dependent oxidoreductase [Leucobacter sp. UT-8R-CII-1-4]|uniref:NAD(P)-dependent oxidoreductase n=1 Tax=Leucobacter sp. UT-8R-CII-1-4 TaxID=3040075 RepID=UPI0024A86090|nr:NAD(P)-dependent oxidoreductase [Leucobacter sp. UT-8R-CII-1-4]MDI6023257.1 NAD(P)-dependent oxidoreductase [Leucobacter sp. UT-8R-CII-1-4]
MTAPHKVLLLDPFGSAELLTELLGDEQEHFEIVATDTLAGHEDAYAILAGPENEVLPADIAACKSLRLVTATSTGHNHLPVAEITAQGAWVTSTAGYCTAEVAEHAFTLLLSGLRALPALDAQVRAGSWAVEEISPRRIAGSTVAIIGFGRIAQALAAHLRQIGVIVRAYDPLVPDHVFAAADVERAATVLDAASGADALSVHVPLLPETEGIIRAEVIAAMAPSSYLVNVARGGLIDEQAMIAALRSGQLSGAALDVFEIEPLPLNAEIRSVPGVLFGPHGAWYSPNAKRQLFEIAVRSLLDVYRGNEPYGLIAKPTA